MKQKQLIKKEPLYLRIVSNIEQLIHNEVLKAGDKLPSIRMVCREQGVSMSTAQLAYAELESKSLIEPRPKSGYYVSQSSKVNLELPTTSNPENLFSKTNSQSLIARVYDTIGEKNITPFSLGIPATEFLPVPKLNKAVLKALRELDGSGTAYEKSEGNSKLRRHIARWSFNWNGKLSEHDIITTSGCLNAITYCMMTLCKKGDWIVVESPVYFGILQLAESFGLKIIELPTHAKTGIEMDAFKKVITNRKVKAILLVSNFNNPLGSCMPDEHKKEVNRLISKYGVPLIEDDIYGDIYFGGSRPKSCKTYDEEGWVLWCGSVSKTLAPGYRVGWVAPGRYYKEIKSLKMLQTISSASLTQDAVANFFETGHYESHLRKLRQTLHMNCLNYIRAIGEFFPLDTKISRPQGGLFLWVEMNKSVNAVDLYEKAVRNNISIAPGSMFTLQNQFKNCMRLSFALPWNEKLEVSLKLLGKLVEGI